MEELGPDEKPWLDALRSADEPTAADRARIRAAVMTSIAAGAAGAGAAALGKSGAVAKAAKVGFFAGAAWKIGLAAVVVSIAGGTVVMTRAYRAPSPVTLAPSAPPLVQAHAQATTSAEAPAQPKMEATAAGEPKPDEEPAPIAATVEKHGSHAAPRTAASSADDLDGELVLLTQAQRALEHGDPTTALAALAQHRREHPKGALSLEREGLRAVASCDAKRPDGKVLAERFVGRNPSSPLVARVRAACLSP